MTPPEADPVPPGQGTLADEVLDNILRGAVKLLGCTSASLVFLDQDARRLRVRPGFMAASAPDLARVEGILGALRDLAVPMGRAEGSLVYAAWRDRTVMETSTLAELAGGAFPRAMLVAADRLLGGHRFIVVPVLSADRAAGVIIFEKPGRQPFSAQQREVLVRYAQRIGQILGRQPGGATGNQGTLPAARLLVDASGAVAGGDGPSRDLPDALVRALAARAAAVLASGPGGSRVTLDGTAAGGEPLEADVVPVRLRGEPFALVTVGREGPAGDPGDRLVRLALGQRHAALLVDPDLRVTSCTEDAGRLFGAAPAHLVDRPAGELFAHPVDVQGILNRQMLFLHGHVEEAAELRRRDGTPFPGRVEALLLADDEDRTIGFLVGVREDPGHGADGPDREVDRLMRRERLATMGEMAAQMAHEIRNPLVAIGATLQVLAREPQPDPETRSLLESAAGEITRLDMLLRDYLSMAARHNAALVPVDLHALAGEVVGLLRMSPRAAGRTLLCEVPAGLAVRADPDGLRHVLFNLVSNAMEAMPSGGTVTVRGSAEDDGAVLAVEDTGPGLPPGDPERFFEPFFSTKRHGTGLGLTVVRKVVASHGGRVSLQDRPGGGCRAAVHLPRRIG